MLRHLTFKGDIYLLIVLSLLGFSMEIYAIVDGRVLPYILDPNFEKYLPIIPSEVSIRFQQGFILGFNFFFFSCKIRLDRNLTTQLPIQPTLWPRAVTNCTRSIVKDGVKSDSSQKMT